MNISDEDVLYENKWLIIDYCMPFSISGLLLSRERPISVREFYPEGRYRSRDDNSPDME